MSDLPFRGARKIDECRIGPSRERVAHRIGLPTQQRTPMQPELLPTVDLT